MLLLFSLELEISFSNRTFLSVFQAVAMIIVKKITIFHVEYYVLKPHSKKTNACIAKPMPNIGMSKMFLTKRVLKQIGKSNF